MRRWGALRSRGPGLGLELKHGPALLFTSPTGGPAHKEAHSPSPSLCCRLCFVIIDRLLAGLGCRGQSSLPTLPQPPKTGLIGCFSLVHRHPEIVDTHQPMPAPLLATAMALPRCAGRGAGAIGREAAVRAWQALGHAWGAPAAGRGRQLSTEAVRAAIKAASGAGEQALPRKQLARFPKRTRFRTRMRSHVAASSQVIHPPTALLDPQAGPQPQPQPGRGTRGPPGRAPGA